jgi:prepilin-type N-terminal cleavage/methylation domain-containing protein
MKFRNSRGFTLIELMIVVSIISTLSSVVFVGLNGARTKGKDTYRVSQIKQVQNALALYYSKYGVYPTNGYSLGRNDSIPRNWADMMTKLRDEGYISVQVSDGRMIPDSPFAWVKTAHAISLPSDVYYSCSIQDPLYKLAADYDYSYGYVVAADQKSYKIRMRLEDPSSPLFKDSYTGTFLDAASTGMTACDKNAPYLYFCTTSVL